MVAEGDASNDVARRRAHMPEGTGAILDTRSLATDHRRLAALLRPGLAVLDVGCGTGAITRGIAEAVGRHGRAVGVDVNASMIEKARASHRGVPSLSFEVADVLALPAGSFDIVTAARVLQWLADPAAALRRMAEAARPGGRVVVLDYNHEKTAWTPPPPESMRRFYAAFLRWRAGAGMDNAIADHLPEIFARVGLSEIVASDQHETTRRADPDFETRAGIWAAVAATRGHQMVADGVISEAERRAAEADYRAWLRDGAQTHVQYLRAVEGVRA
ncbi:MAG: ubiquinone biosynthesis methyltransferase UbiE [Candidatus Rokuibacteriota bacterium]|nr:MAG: ubiquinone biosynthesis methyltransferase UbiE [Candidatus Rokubacteria bacterium]